MRWASTLATEPDLDRALATICDDLEAQLQGASPTLLLAYVSPDHREGFLQVPRVLSRRFPGAALAGCSAAGVIAHGREVERTPAIAVMAAELPGVETRVFHVRADALPGDREAWRARLGLGTQRVHALLMVDPFSCYAPAVVAALESVVPEGVKIGGLASGSDHPGGNVLYENQTAHGSGCVGVALAGAIDVAALVAQGCRPIGTPLFVTRAEGNVIRELDGRAPARVLQELYEQLPGSDKELAYRALYLGLAARAQEIYAPGDFLIRNVLAVDSDSGALAVGAGMAQGTVVQFHLRDRESADRELDDLLRAHAATRNRTSPDAAVMFECVGRGRGLYGDADHDVAIVQRHLSPAVVGGCFCSGEIGPVAGRSGLHGYSTVVGACYAA